MPNLRLVTFDTNHIYKGLKNFDCGNEMINTFVYKSLKKRVKRNFSQAYVLLDEKETFIGFYTLETFALSKALFESTQKPIGVPPMLPVIKLSMIGLDKSVQGQGLGKRLLRDALLKVVQISKIAGCAGIYLLAEKDAVAFYKKLGFVPLKESMPLPMFLDIEVVLGSID